MRAEQLKQWRAEAYPDRDEEPNRTHWDPLVQLVQHVFLTGEIPQGMAHSVCVLLPKPDGGVRGLGLLEIVWKVVASILTVRLNAGIRWHDSIHGFRTARGTGTAIIEAKLFQQLARIDQCASCRIELAVAGTYILF